MADGFVLNVDAKFLQDLEKADKKMSDLVDKSNSLSKSVVEAFNKMSAQGVDPFLEKLRQQKTALEAIANVDIGKNPSKGIRDLVKTASQSVDQINKLIIALQGAGTAMDLNRATKKVDSEIKKETDSYLKELEKQIKARQEYLSRQERVEQERVKITQDATKQVENEIKKETDAYLKNLEIKIKAAQEQQLRNEQIRSQRESIAKQAKANVEAEIKAENDAYLKGLNDRIRQAQEYQARNERVASERKRIESEVVKHVENEIKKEKDAHLKSLSDQIKARQEYLERVRKLQEAQARKESEMRAKEFRRIQQYGDTSGQATSAYNRLYGEHGVKSVNNMNRALQKLQDAQNKLNLNTDKGRQKYDELGKKIQQIKRDLDKATQANEKFHNSHSKLLNTTDQLQRKLALLFSISAIQGYMDKLVNVRKEFELQQKSLQVLLRDKDQADKLWQQTIDLAVKSPFRVSQLVSYTKQLAAYRIESDKLYDTTKMLSDVSAGLGVDMQRIILAFGQVRAANFLRGTELRQFTEAGIPMLDELAQMFTELEGRVVKAGDVFERISKRMVTFSDVEEVFKRMTSSSGVFYNMQEEQSKTLFGMISNLHDSIDLMLNDIGRSNDGIIKDMVSLTRDLVENWRGVATVLKQVGVTLAMIGLAKFVTGWRIASTAIATGSTSAALAMNGMAGSAARLRIAMSTLGKTISAHPWFLLVGAVASAGHALWEYIEAIDASNAKYDDMSRREIAHIDQLEELQKKTEQYNAIIEDGNASEQARNKAQLENDKILSQIKAKYPELYPLIVQQENKTIDLTKAIERQNEVLGVNIALQQKAKGDFFQEDFSENYKDALESQDALKSSLVSLQAEASQASAQLKALSLNGELPKDVAKSFDKLFKSLRKSKSLEEARVVINEINKSFSQLGAGMLGKSELHNVIAEIKDDFSSLWRSQQDYTKSLNSWGANLDRQMDAFRVGIEDAMGGLEPSKRNNAATQWVNQQLDALGVVDKELKKWAQQYIVRETGIKLTFVDEGKKIYTEADLTKEWQKKIWGAIKKVESTNPDIRLGVTLEDVATQDLATVIKTLKESVESAIKENKNVVDVGQIVGQVAYTPQQIQNAKDSVEPLQALADVIGLIIKQTSGNKGKDWMSEVVKGIKEAHQEYIKLNKTLDDSEAKQLALNKYAKSFAESAKNAGLKDISLGQFKFETEEGAIEALTFLKNKLPQSAKQARFKLEEAIGEIRGEVRIRTKAEDDKILIEQIEDMFSGYEMSIELQKLNIPTDLAKQLFNIDSIDLSGLKSRVEGLQSLFIGTDMEGKYKEYLQKISEMEEKEQVERLKSYTKYIVKAQSERARITFEALEKIRKAEEMHQQGKFNETEMNNIRENINKERDKALADLAFNEFKNSDLYLKMFEDFDSVSIPVLEAMKERVENLRKSLKELGASSEDVKNLTQQLEKIDDAIQERNPFKDLFKNIKEYRKLQGERDKTESEYKEKLEENEKLTKALAEASKEVGAAKSEYNKAMEQATENQTLKNAQSELDIAKARLAVEINANGAETQKAIALQQEVEKKQQAYDVTYKTLVLENKSVKTAKERLDNANKAEESAKNALNKSNTDLSALLSKLKDMEELSEKIAATLQFVGQVFQELASTVTDVASSLENVFGAMDAKTSDTISSISEILGGLGNTASGVGRVMANPMDIGGYFQAISGLASTIGSIFAIGDKKKERQIQREIKFVEDLERAYEKLEKAIDNAYSINTLQASGQAAKKNIDAQIASYNKMIAAEEDKKKTDKDRIKEWQLAIEDLIEQKAELDKELVSVATSGIMDDVLSASQEFTNAWLEAFNETGDGLSGLETNFKETMLEMVKQQAAMLISQSYVEKWKKQLEQYINPDDLELSTDEAKKWVDAVSNSLPQLNDALTRYFEAMQNAGVDLGGGTSGELSGLAKGISVITESQADILAAYANSCRFFLANIDTTLTSVANQILGGENMPNPILSELRTQTELVRGISTLLNSLTSGGHSMGGRGFRVFIS